MSKGAERNGQREREGGAWDHFGQARVSTRPEPIFLPPALDLGKWNLTKIIVLLSLAKCETFI